MIDSDKLKKFTWFLFGFLFYCSPLALLGLSIFGLFISWCLYLHLCGPCILSMRAKNLLCI